MALKTDGIEQMKMRLTRLAKAPVIADAELKRCAEDVAQKARDMAPIDYGDLKRAIQVGRRGSDVRDSRGRFVSGYSTYEVFINNNTPVRDPSKLSRDVTRVGDYVWWVHEHMGWASMPNPHFMPSDLSVQTGLAAGVEAGGMFMIRALYDMEDSVHERLASVVDTYVKTGLDK
jgi:hypothetical protein